MTDLQEVADTEAEEVTVMTENLEVAAEEAEVALE